MIDSLIYTTAGIQTKLFFQEQAGPIKQNDWVLRPEGFGGKLN